MNNCSQCGIEYVMIEATPEVLEHTEGAESFAETVRFLGGSLEGWQIGMCLNCRECVIRSGRFTIGGVVS